MVAVGITDRVSYSSLGGITMGRDYWRFAEDFGFLPNLVPYLVQQDCLTGTITGPPGPGIEGPPGPQGQKGRVPDCWPKWIVSNWNFIFCEKATYRNTKHNIQDFPDLEH